jgi:predicted RNA-binding protein with PIN domain
MIYIVDGHNLIPKLPGLSLDAVDDELRLIERLQVFCRIQRSSVQVFFDRAPAGFSGARSFGSVRAHFVPAGTIADDAIARHLQRLGKAARNQTLVSSDRRVQAEGRSAGAQVLSSETFAGLILDAEAKAAETARTAGQPLSVGEVDEWLELFKARRKDS